MAQDAVGQHPSEVLAHRVLGQAQLDSQPLRRGGLSPQDRENAQAGRMTEKTQDLSGAHERAHRKHAANRRSFWPGIRSFNARFLSGRAHPIVP